MSVYYKWNASAAWTIAAQEEMCAFSDETGLREPIARKAFSLLRRFAGGLLNFLFLGGILKHLRGVSLTANATVVKVLEKGLKGASSDSYANELLQGSTGGLFKAGPRFCRAWTKAASQC